MWGDKLAKPGEHASGVGVRVRVWMMVMFGLPVHRCRRVARRGVVARCMIAHERSLPRLASDSLASRAVSVWTTWHDALGDWGMIDGRTVSVSATADHAEQTSPAARLGLQRGMVIQELGYDDDCDETLRDAIEELIGHELVDEDYDDVVDVVLLWWREDDGDLVDALVDAKTSLADGGVVWLLTPKTGRSGHVEPSDIGDAAPTAGLSQTTTVSAAQDWSGTRLVAPKSRSKR